MSNKSLDLFVLKRILRIFLCHKTKTLLIVTFLTIYVGISFFVPIMNKKIVDDGILSNNFSVALRYSCWIALLGLLHAAVNILKEKTRVEIYISAYSYLTSEAFDALKNTRITFFNTKNSTDIFNDIEVDTSNMLLLFGENVFFAVTQFVTFFGGLVGLFTIDYRMASVVLVFIPVKYAITKILGRMRKATIEGLIKAKSQYAHWFGDTLQGMKDIRLFGLHNKLDDDLNGIILSIASSKRRLTLLDSCNEGVEIFFVQVIMGIIYGVGAYLILRESLTLGTLFAFIGYSMYVIDPISSFLDIQYTFAGVIPSAHRYYRFIDEAKAQTELSGDRVVNSISTIEFRDVSFSYAGIPVLQNVNFIIKRGEKVAIVGENGSGKSTILSLIQKFHEPDSGRILIDGIDLLEIELTSFRNALSCINQGSYLFDIGILENIRLYKNIAAKQLSKALNQSQVNVFFKEKSTLGIGQNGGSLSGGQKQKVLLARLLLKKGHLYLLDEATANLDLSAEEAIMKLLDTELKPETVVIVTHKNELLLSMQKIIYLHGDGTLSVYCSYNEFATASKNREYPC